MIFIKKNKHPPKAPFVHAGHPHHGKQKWKVATRSVLHEYAANPNQFNAGLHQFSADFGYDVFRDKLLECQGPKCCFCEKPIHNGAIEHFRPKKGYQQNRGGALSRPGYYWLAYNWDNMLLSCTECNSQGQKGNYFPVNGARGISPTDCSAEDCVIINPTKINPSRFITFNYSTPAGVDPAGRGRDNIAIFKLDTRGDLLPIREYMLLLYQTQKGIASLPAPVGTITRQQIRDAKKLLKNARMPKHPFSGMINENIRKGLI